MSIGIKGTGSAAVTDGSVTNIKLADVPQDTFKGRVASGIGVPKDLSISDFSSSLPFLGDFVLGFSASGGLRKFVAEKFLNVMSTGVATASTASIDADSMQHYYITALASAVNFALPSGTPTNGQKLVIRVKDDGTARAITWNAIFRGVNLTLPAITIVGDTLYVEAYYNSTDTKWDVVKVTTTLSNISGSGTTNYVPLWTPNGTTLGNSQIRDNGTSVGINSAGFANTKLYINALSSQTVALNTAINATTGDSYSIIASNSSLQGNAYGIDSRSNGLNPSGTNVGLWARASQGLNNYAVQLQDGTEGVGKFLKSIDANGNANWATISTSDISGYAGLTDGDKGDITVSSSGVVWTIDNQSVTLAKMQHIATNRFLGRTTAGTGDIESLTTSQATAMLNAFTTSLQGVVPASGGGTSNFLRADGTWAVPTGLITAIAGTTDYLARWTNTTTLGVGIFRDNGTTAGINTAPQATSLISTTSNLNITLDSNNSKASGDPVVISAVMNGGAATTTSTAIKTLVGDTTGIAFGVYSQYQGLTGGIADSTLVSAGDGVAGYFKGHATTGNVYGVIGVSAPVGSTPSATNIGGRFYAKFGGNNYSVQLQDGTEGSGKFLKSVSADGKANWSSILVSDITNSTSLALGLGSIELGHATDTTITRVSAGVIAVEGVTVATATNTLTLTNKRITSRVQSVTSSATVTPNADNDDSVEITAQAAGLTIASPTGTPTSHQKLIIRIKDNGTARAITWNAIYRAIGVTLPTTTVISKTMYLGFIYNVADTKWDCVAVNQEA